MIHRQAADGAVVPGAKAARFVAAPIVNRYILTMGELLLQYTNFILTDPGQSQKPCATWRNSFRLISTYW
jgi:hypothetical protein